MIKNSLLLAIISLFLGGFGGSFQPTRLFILVGLGFILFNLKNKVQLSKVSFFLPIFFVYMFWISYGLFSLFWSADISQGFFSEIIVMIVGMSSLFLILYSLSSLSDIEVAYAWVIALFATLPFAFYEIFTGYHFSYNDEERIFRNINFNAPFASVFFGNYNNYSAFISLCFPFALYLLLHEKFHFNKKIFVSLTIFLSIVIIIINGSKGALLSILLVFFIYFIFKIKKFLPYFIYSIPFVFSFLIFIPNDILDIFYLLFEYRFINVDLGNNQSERIGHLFSSIDFLEDSFGFGIGAGSFEALVIHSKYYLGIVNPHNLLIEIGVQYGLIVLFLFCFLFIRLFLNYKEYPSFFLPFLVSSIFIIPVVGVINSSAIGYTYWWIYFNSIFFITYFMRVNHSRV
jgi:hypothetical protein